MSDQEHIAIDRYGVPEEFCDHETVTMITTDTLFPITLIRSNILYFLPQGFEEIVDEEDQVTRIKMRHKQNDNHIYEYNVGLVGHGSLLLGSVMPFNDLMDALYDNDRILTIGMARSGGSSKYSSESETEEEEDEF